jgi:hypothetical protein
LQPDLTVGPVITDEISAIDPRNLIMASTDEEKREEEEELLPSTNQLSIVTSEDEAVEVTLEEKRRKLEVTYERELEVIREEHRRKLEVLDRELREHRRELEIKDQKANGTYFSLQSTVCECQREKLEEMTVTVDLRRTKSQAKAISRYAETLKTLNTVDSLSQPAYGSARGNIVWKKAKNLPHRILTLPPMKKKQ